MDKKELIARYGTQVVEMADNYKKAKRFIRQANSTGKDYVIDYEALDGADDTTKQIFVSEQDIVDFMNEASPRWIYWISYGVKSSGGVETRFKPKLYADHFKNWVDEVIGVTVTKEHPNGLYWTGRYWEFFQSIQEAKDTLKAEVHRSLQLFNEYDSQPVGDIKKLTEFVVSQLTSPKTVTFNANKWALNAQNGTYHANTHEMTPHRRGDYITGMLPIKIDATGYEGGLSPTWNSYMEYMYQEDAPTVMAFHGLQFFQFIGNIQKALFIYGTAGNGKSTILKRFLSHLGGQGTETKLGDLSGSDAGYYIADLAGKTGMFDFDAANLRVNNIDQFKSLISGDPMKSRAIHGKPFNLEPTAHMIFNVNESYPRFKDDSGMARRLMMIKADAPTTEGEGGKNVRNYMLDNFPSNKLDQETPAFVAYAIEQAYQAELKGELPQSERSKTLTDEWLGSSDFIQLFIREHVVEVEGNGASLNRMHSIYKDMVQLEFGSQPMNLRPFNDWMEKRHGWEKTNSATKGRAEFAEYVDDYGVDKRRWKGRGVKTEGD